MYAAITADIVSSRKKIPKSLEQKTAELSKIIEQKLFRRKKTFEFYRGDSFQGIVPPEKALLTALLWKSGIKSIEDKNGSWDIRIAIGIGEVDYQGKKTGTSTGSALEFSGILLDKMKTKTPAGIGVVSSVDAWNEQLETECLFADALMERWTAGAADTVFHAFLQNETQEQLATRFSISQSSVHKRLNTANWSVFKHWEAYFRQQVVSYMPNSETK